MALQGHGEEGRPRCLNCLEDGGPPRLYVCSIKDCENQPIYLAVVENDVTSSVLVCERHFDSVRSEITSFLEVPPWLTNGNDFVADEGGVVFEFEVGPGND
jgi:hypothetical protein